jgi:hypothetical protein
VEVVLILLLIFKVKNKKEEAAQDIVSRREELTPCFEVNFAGLSDFFTISFLKVLICALFCFYIFRVLRVHVLLQRSLLSPVTGYYHVTV